MFTIENTQGTFTQETLDKMNAELSGVLAELDQDCADYDDEVKNASDRIFNKYC